VADEKHVHAYDKVLSEVTGIRRGKWVTTKVLQCSCTLTTTETTEQA
jgi:hypothetical protein